MWYAVRHHTHVILMHASKSQKWTNFLNDHVKDVMDSVILLWEYVNLSDINYKNDDQSPRHRSWSGRSRSSTTSKFPCNHAFFFSSIFLISQFSDVTCIFSSCHISCDSYVILLTSLHLSPFTYNSIRPPSMSLFA